MNGPQRRDVHQALQTALAPDPRGSQSQKEAWMRQRMRERTSKIEGQREAELLAEAEAARQRAIITRCERELALHRQILAEIESTIRVRCQKRR